MSVTYSRLYDRGASEKRREQVRKDKSEIMQWLHPSVNYMCWFLEYFPELNNDKDRNAIRSVWNGATARPDICKYISDLNKKLKERNAKAKV